MGSQVSRTNISSSSRSRNPPPSSIEPPLARTTSGPNFNTNTQANPIDSDLRSYEAVCRGDPELRTFDSNLRLHTSRAIRSISVRREVSPLSLDSLSKVTECLFQLNQEMDEIILQNEEDILKNKELSDLVVDYLENSLLTLDFCTALDACLERAGHIESIINIALKKFEEEHYVGEGSVKSYSKTLEELRKFREARDPFTQEFFKVFNSVYSRQVFMFEKLQAKKLKLDKKLGKLQAWKKVSNVIFIVAFASVLICSVVVVAVSAPPVLTALVAAASIPLGSMGSWLNSFWEECEKDLSGLSKIISSMKNGSYIVLKDFDSIRVMVDRFQIEIKALLDNACFATRGEEEAVIISVEEIKSKVNGYSRTIHKLSEHAKKCTENTRLARTLILERIIYHRSSSNPGISMFSCCCPCTVIN